ncbi:MAG: sulfurtransferase [Acidimicrobiales bacterium]|nr:sulfurtransferase [Acidimicrobiales bacterium]
MSPPATAGVPLGSAARIEPPPPWQRNAVFATIGFTIVLGWVGDALWAGLVDKHPLTLIALNAKPRYQLLTVNDLDAWTYYTFTTLRLLCTKPLVWLVGAWYGDRAVGWAEQRSKRGAGLIRWVERHFGRWGWVAIAITSNNVMCLLAGAAGFSLGWFMLLAVVGTVARLWLVRLFGARFTKPINDVIGFVGDHRLAVIAASIAVVVGGLWWQHRAGRSSLDDLASLERAVEVPDADDDIGGNRTEGRA